MKSRWQKINDWAYKKGKYTMTYAKGVIKPYSIWYIENFNKWELAECLGHFAEKSEAIECQKLHSQQEANNAQSDITG